MPEKRITASGQSKQHSSGKIPMTAFEDFATKCFNELPLAMKLRVLNYQAAVEISTVA